MTASAPQWVLPASIPFPELKARDLEECVYWLLDAIGARDLAWRVGGSGGGAADGGRDLEAVFYVSSPDGEMEPQRWWIECKGRKDTVEPDAIKSAVNNALALGELAYLVVVTNTTFSNPTRDWVKTWQASHPRPHIKLWDQVVLERLLSRQPSVVLRLFAKALSPIGRLEATSERFWNKLEYTPVGLLQDFWKTRETLNISPIQRIALIANEFAHGSIVRRPWGTQADIDSIVHATQIGLLNVAYLINRASMAGVEQDPLIQTLAHLILIVLQNVAADAVTALVLESIGSREGKALPDKVIENLLMPILDRVRSEMQDVCSSDCLRFHGERHAFLPPEGDAVENYWYRFSKKGLPEKNRPSEYLLIESTSAPCNVGFELDQERCCPLFHFEPQLNNVAEFLTIIERVSEFRLAKARAKDFAEP
jgi:hypothetical protein